MESIPDKKERRRKWIRSLLYLLRDLGIAALIVGIILLSLFLYTSNWPPMVVVESKSMQHSETDSFIGTIDTGDLVLVQRAPSSRDVTTYVEGRANGHGTYSGYGDVIIYKQNGDFQDKSIIHRALVRLVWNESSETVDIPDLDDPKWVLGTDWSGRTMGGEDVTSPYGLDGTVQLNNVVFDGRNITVEIWKYKVQFKSESFNRTSIAYVALGDNNRVADPQIIKQEWIEGKARGEIPWFGLLKLTLFRDSGAPCCGGWGDPSAPENSWNSLLISIVLIVAVPISLDFGISYLLEFRRKRAEAAEEGSSEAGVETPPEESRESPVDEETDIEEEPLEEPESLEETEEPEELPEDEGVLEGSEEEDASEDSHESGLEL
ncbi:MAG: hypothetical protein ACE5IJ_01500 [Thermoplasmata archaeon]